ncbi:MAG: FtsQ-type POTRA domain-containing protein [Akkermansiaceae bacterium]|nr:FtsQ-type POTRA domain-containing protein [Akkermansiaceae bacterium]
MKRKTRKTRRRMRSSVLEARVMSPRIVWHGTTRLFGRLLRLALLLALLAGIGWGIWSGIQHTFHNNPDFRLQVIDLNPNPIIDEADLVEIAGIDLTVDTSLFEIDVNTTRKHLEVLPAVVEAQVERQLPGTLKVRITHRQPQAWVATTGSKLDEVRTMGGLLLDADGHVYPCPARQLEEALKLPIFLLEEDEQHPLTLGQQLEHPQLARCFKLLEAARNEDAESARWIESIRQANEWSLRLVTRQGTSATFGLREHPVQMRKLRAALDHAAQKGYQIDTINLIPRFNVPITVRGENPPRRAIPVEDAVRTTLPDRPGSAQARTGN